MKVIDILLAVSIVLLLGISCKTSKKATVAYSVYNIALEEGLTSEYFTKVYEQYGPHDIKPTNKTLNEYRVKFTISVEQQANMLIEMSDDINIKSIAAGSLSDTNVTSSTSSQSSKVTINKDKK